MSRIKFARLELDKEELVRPDSESQGSVEKEQETVSICSEGREEGAEAYYEGKCGLFRWNPGCLQVLNSPRALLASLCYFVTLQGAVATGFISVGLSSIERRYHLTSSLSAFASISNEIGAILSLPMVSYLGARYHKPRVLGFSLMCMGVGSIIFASPQFFSGAYVYTSNTSTELCTSSPSSVSQCESPLYIFYLLLVTGNVIVGCGASVLYTVGLGFLDESTHPRYTPIYFSVFSIVSVLGPALGFGLGGLFLSLFVDPLTPTHLTQQDPQWVGAWWLGFLLAGVMSIIGSIQFFLYPRRLKASHRYDELRKEQQPIQNEGAPICQDHEASIRTMLREYPRYVYRILKNPTFLCATLGIAFASFVVVGLVTFLPKFVEVEFALDASLSSYIIGGVSIPAVSIGMSLGGLTLFYFKKLTVERLALLVFILTAVELVIPPLFLIGCDSDKIAGVNYDYPNSTARTNFAIRNLNLSCLPGCHCSSNAYQPVCSQGVTFFSPCLAGCTAPRTNGTYLHCSCLSGNSTVVQGKCRNNCTVKLVIGALLMSIAISIVFYNDIPFLKLTLRSVADKDRTVALGIQSFLTRLLGNLPGPLLVGGLFDTNCILWQETVCGERGSCLEYNTSTLRYSLVVVIALGVGGSSISFFLAWISWKRRKIPENHAEFKNTNL